MGSASDTFLSMFFGDEISESDRVALWTLHNKQHQWFDSKDGAIAAAEKLKEKDTYFSVGLYPRGVTKRTQDNVSKIFGVWLDIDCGEKNNGKSYFPTTEDALTWVYDSLCQHWSIIVHSGSGLHLYLLFDEPLEILDDDVRLAARRCEAAFHSWATSICQYDLDPVVDLSRIMRLPGTRNTKAKEWCQIVDSRDFRVPFSELVDQLPSVTVGSTRNLASIDGDIDVEDIKKRINMIAGVDTTFQQTWKRVRRFADQSPSAYCMSIANQLVTAGFSDSETLAALKLWRESQPDAKDKPDSWYATTVGKARSAHSQTEDAKEFDITLSAAMLEDDQEQREEASAEVFGAKLKRIVKVRAPEHKGQKASVKYRLEFDDGKVVIDSTAQLLNQGYMKQKLFEDLGIVMRNMKGVQYDKVLQILLNMMDTEEEAAEANPAFSMEQELKAFVAAKIAQCEVCTDLGLYQRGQLYKDEEGNMWFGFEPFRMRLQSTGSHKAKGEVASLLRTIGSNPTQMTDRGRTRLWMVPEDCR